MSDISRFDMKHILKVGEKLDEHDTGRISEVVVETHIHVYSWNIATVIYLTNFKSL